MAGQRLTLEELVETVFSCFWRDARRHGLASIEGITIPIDQIREEVSLRTGSPRQNNKWIHTQLRRYERNEGVSLFEKTRRSDGTEALRIHDTLKAFVQKKHLHRPEKLRLANAIADLLDDSYADANRPVRIALGAGTTIALLAEVINRRVGAGERRVDVYTHNMGVIEVLSRPDVAQGVTLHVTEGRFDPVTYAILSDGGHYGGDDEFDLVVQGASMLHDGSLYVESERECSMKRSLLYDTDGLKLLVLTLHEFTESPPSQMHRFGTIDAYDLIIVPRMKHPTTDQERAITWIRALPPAFEPQIRQWHYEIFARHRVPHASHP